MRVGAEGRGTESRFRLNILCNFKLIKEKADEHGPEGSCAADGGVTRSGRRPLAVAFLEPNLGTSKNSGMPRGCGSLALGGRWPHLLHTAGRPLQLRGASPYAQRPIVGGQRINRTDTKARLELGYVRPEEMPQIPRLGKGLSAILFAPRGGTAAALEQGTITRLCQEAAATTINGLTRFGRGNRIEMSWPRVNNSLRRINLSEVKNEFFSSGGDPHGSCRIGSQDSQSTEVRFSGSQRDCRRARALPALSAADPDK